MTTSSPVHVPTSLSFPHALLFARYTLPIHAPLPSASKFRSLEQLAAAAAAAARVHLVSHTSACFIFAAEGSPALDCKVMRAPQPVLSRRALRLMHLPECLLPRFIRTSLPCIFL